tara:strand:- start:939 stop:2678 length:1740 start_codon:yes stop_codon:yes gene_type:complete
MIKYKNVILSFCFISLLSCGKSNDVIPTNNAPENQEENIETQDPVTGVRIVWDYITKKIISDPNDTRYNGYARLIQLQDGSLLVTYESHGNTLVKKSMDGGDNWSAPITVAPFSDGVNMATPDVIQLQDGTILLTYNPRPSATALPIKKFLIKTILSTDDGLTWQNDQVAYEGDTVFENGVWEPSAIQLPSGEVQLFFSNENMYQSSNEQNISLLRSQDNGLTWTTEPEIASFRAGSRDGMPSPIYLEDQNTLVYSIEDNGTNNSFKPYIIRNTLSENWSETVTGSSSNRNYALFDPLDDSEYAGAPYLARLSTGEVLLSYQGTEKRNGNSIDNADMKVAIGTNSATNFNRTTTPFIIPEGKSALWNSIAVLDDDTVVALATTNAFGSGTSQVWMIKGHIVPEITVLIGTVDIDGDTFENSWEQNLPIFIGQKGATNLKANFLSDTDYLYLQIKVKDNSVSSLDATTIYLDPQATNYVAPGSGVFKFIISATNQISTYEGFNANWEETTITGLTTASKNSSNGYIQEVKIPWTALGGNPSSGSRIGYTMELIERGTANYTETISTTDKDSPYTWLSLYL